MTWAATAHCQRTTFQCRVGVYQAVRMSGCFMYFILIISMAMYLYALCSITQSGRGQIQGMALGDWSPFSFGLYLITMPNFIIRWLLIHKSSQPHLIIIFLKYYNWMHAKVYVGQHYTEKCTRSSYSNREGHLITKKDSQKYMCYNEILNTIDLASYLCK